MAKRADHRRAEVVRTMIGDADPVQWLGGFFATTSGDIRTLGYAKSHPEILGDNDPEDWWLGQRSARIAPLGRARHVADGIAPLLARAFEHPERVETELRILIEELAEQWLLALTPGPLDSSLQDRLSNLLRRVNRARNMLQAVPLAHRPQRESSGADHPTATTPAWRGLTRDQKKQLILTHAPLAHTRTALWEAVAGAVLGAKPGAIEKEAQRIGKEDPGFDSAIQKAIATAKEAAAATGHLSESADSPKN